MCAIAHYDCLNIKVVIRRIKCKGFIKCVACCRMLDELEGPGGRASREFRQKFPDEIVTDNLGGQVITSHLIGFVSVFDTVIS